MSKQTIRDIGSRKQLFLDDYVVAETTNLARAFHAAEKHSRNPVLPAEKPWEFPTSAGVCCPKVLYDRAQGLYRMWYETFLFGKREYVCYATSRDGLEWERPTLGLVEFEGSTANNIVDTGGLDFPQLPRALVYSPEMQGIEPAERLYKALQWEGDGALGAYFSEDGLRWTPYENNPILSGVGDCVKLCAFSDDYPMQDYDKACFGDNPPRYLAFPKVGVKVAGKSRRSVGYSACEVPISYSTNRIKSFVEWSKPILVLAPDYRDDEMGSARIDRAKEEGVIRFDKEEDRFTDFYGMAVLPYDGLYIGFLEVFDHSYDMRRMGAWNQHGIFEMQLTCSRDLIHWERVGDRMPVIARGGADDWDRCMILMAAPVITSDEIRVYYQGTSIAHSDRLGFDRVWTEERARKVEAGERTPLSCVGLVSLRLDGFVSVDAASTPGTLLTRPLRFRGERLFINAEAEGGAVGVEVLGANGQPLEGFTRDDCDPFSGDSLRHGVTWRGGTSRLPRSEEPIQLRFTLHNAKLYAFQFV